MFDNTDKHILEGILAKYNSYVRENWRNISFTLVHTVDGFSSYSEFLAVTGVTPEGLKVLITKEKDFCDGYECYTRPEEFTVDWEVLHNPKEAMDNIVEEQERLREEFNAKRKKKNEEIKAKRDKTIADRKLLAALRKSKDPNVKKVLLEAKEELENG